MIVYVLRHFQAARSAQVTCKQHCHSVETGRIVGRMKKMLGRQRRGIPTNDMGDWSISCKTSKKTIHEPSHFQLNLPGIVQFDTLPCLQCGGLT